MHKLLKLDSYIHIVMLFLSRPTIMYPNDVSLRISGQWEYIVYDRQLQRI